MLEDYVIWSLNMYEIWGWPIGAGDSEHKKPPLDFHQVVVWYGGDEENRIMIFDFCLI